MILFSLSGLFKAIWRLWKERKNIEKFGEWGWTLAMDCYALVEDDADAAKQDKKKRNWTKETKALNFDAMYLESYEKAMKKSLSEETLLEVREEAWKFFNKGKERSPAPKSTKSKLRRVGKARRR